MNEKVQHWVWVVTETIEGTQQLLALEMEEKKHQVYSGFSIPGRWRSWNQAV